MVVSATSAAMAMLTPPERLDPLGDRVDQFALLVEVLVEQQVQLVEGRPGHLPVMLLVQVAQGHRVGQHLVQVLDALLAGRLGQRNGHSDKVPERLNLVGLLVHHRAGMLQDFIGIEDGFAHGFLLRQDFLLVTLHPNKESLTSPRSRVG